MELWLMLLIVALAVGPLYWARHMLLRDPMDLEPASEEGPDKRQNDDPEPVGCPGQRPANPVAFWAGLGMVAFFGASLVLTSPVATEQTPRGYPLWLILGIGCAAGLFLAVHSWSHARR